MSSAGFTRLPPPPEYRLYVHESGGVSRVPWPPEKPFPEAGVEFDADGKRARIWSINPTPSGVIEGYVEFVDAVSRATFTGTDWDAPEGDREREVLHTLLVDFPHGMVLIASWWPIHDPFPSVGSTIYNPEGAPFRITRVTPRDHNEFVAHAVPIIDAHHTLDADGNHKHRMASFEEYVYDDRADHHPPSRTLFTRRD